MVPLTQALQAEIEATLAADASLPGIVLSVHAPRLGLSWSGTCSRDGELNADDALRIASVTKVYVAATALRLVEQGLLNLFEPIAIPLGENTCQALVGAGYDPDRITLFQLLTHTSGLIDHAAAPAYAAAVRAQPARVWTRGEQIELAMELTAARGGPPSPPGMRFGYSDTGYLLVAELIERRSGLPLPAAVRLHLGLHKMGLVHTHFEALEASPTGQRRARQRLGPALDVAAIDATCDLFGGGGMVSTASEVVAFLRALLRGQVFEQPGTLACGLMTPTVSFAPGDWLHSALLRGRPLGSLPCWGHGGFWGLYAACFAASDVTFFVSWNQAECADATRGAPGVPGLADRLAALLHHGANSRP